jgi:hypothetical protein
MAGPIRFATLDREQVIGTLRAAGSRDPDVLDARRVSLLRGARLPKFAGTCVLVLGAVATLTILVTRTILGPSIGVPILAAGWWLRRRGVRNVATVEAAYREFVRLPV